jgi:hypothetical protein
MAEKKESFESRVKKEIERTGLPTEIKATDILKKNGWNVFNEYPYLDTDENKVRTLDMVANKVFLKNNDGETEIDFFCELYIECKKSEGHSWVFFTETSPAPFIKFALGRLADDAVYGTFNAVAKAYAELHKEVKVKDLEKRTSIFSRIPVRFETFRYKIALSQKPVFCGKDDFFEAVMQVLKSLSHEEREKARGESSEFLPKDIVIPVILFDGFLFECYYQKGQIRTPKINHTRYLAHGLPNQRLPALIDVVASDYFPTYLRRIEKELTFKIRCN